MLMVSPVLLFKILSWWFFLDKCSWGYDGWVFNHRNFDARKCKSTRVHYFEHLLCLHMNFLVTLVIRNREKFAGLLQLMEVQFNTCLQSHWSLFGSWFYCVIYYTVSTNLALLTLNVTVILQMGNELLDSQRWETFWTNFSCSIQFKCASHFCSLQYQLRQACSHFWSKTFLSYSYLY